MFLLSKILTPFIIVPGLFLLFFVPIFILIHKQQWKILRIIITAFLIVFYLSTIQPMGDLFLFPLERAHPSYNWQDNHGADYIVLLGGGYVDSSPDEGGEESLSPDSLKRLVYAFRIHQKTALPIICAGGRALKSEEFRSEGEIYAQLLMELGVESKNLFIDSMSRNTWENAKEVKKNWDPQKIILVTSAYHMNRSVLCFKNQQISVIPAATDYKINNSGYNFFSFLPNAANLRNVSIATREYIGLIIYGLLFFH